LTTATTTERRALKAILQTSHTDFSRYFFKRSLAERFRVGPHHRIIAQVLEDVFMRRRTRVIINIPPGFSKTMLAVIMMVARGFGMFPQARFLHASFSDPLVRFNSTTIRDIIGAAEYQALWPTEFRADQNTQGLWTTQNGGQFMAKPADGPVTGFRAGRMDANEIFSGALLIDDPLKPADASSKPKRDKVNNNFNLSLRNRIMREEVPIIVIQQRLHMDDMSGFLLKGGSGDVWDHLLLPVTIDNSVEYPSEYTHGLPIEHGLPDGPLWAEKFSEKQIELLKTAEYVFWSQYMQNPMAMGGALFKRDYLSYWDTLPNLLWRAIFADTANKEGEENDYSVFQCWGAGVDGNAYLIDQLRGKWDAPKLQQQAQFFWAKHKQDDKILGRGYLRAMKIEDKASGTGLLQSLKGIPVIGIPRNTEDKVTRGMDTAPAFANGMVKLPRNAPWLPGYIAELLAFPGGQNDDQVDPTMDAVADIIGKGMDILRLL